MLATAVTQAIEERRLATSNSDADSLEGSELSGVPAAGSIMSFFGRSAPSSSASASAAPSGSSSAAAPSSSSSSTKADKGLTQAQLQELAAAGALQHLISHVPYGKASLECLLIADEDTLAHVADSMSTAILATAHDLARGFAASTRAANKEVASWLEPARLAEWGAACGRITQQRHVRGMSSTLLVRRNYCQLLAFCGARSLPLPHTHGPATRSCLGQSSGAPSEMLDIVSSLRYIAASDVRRWKTRQQEIQVATSAAAAKEKGRSTSLAPFSLASVFAPPHEPHITRNLLAPNDLITFLPLLSWVRA